MSKAEVMNKVTRNVYKVGMKLKKHSPAILVVAGTVGVVTSGVMACKATLKVHDIIEESKSDIESIEKATKKLENGEVLKHKSGVEYTMEDAQNDLKIAHRNTAIQFVKLYAPSVALGVVSLGCILTSHRILTKRNVALGAAFAAADRTLKDYRGRVVERFGEKLDKELLYGIKEKEVEEIVVDENGNETIEKNTVVEIDPETANKLKKYSLYSKFFDESCNGFTKSAELNMIFLRQQQEYANQKLRRKGYLFLNEVYEMLGIDRTTAGQLVGWIYDEKCPNGDNYVDFGILDIDSEGSRAFVNGYEPRILLDFNVDGEIYKLI